MQEQIVGVRPREIQHVIKSREGGSMAFAAKHDFLADTIGHVMAIPLTHIPFWTPGAMFRTPSAETINYLADRYKDVPWKGDTLVRVDHTSFLGDIQRTFADSQDIKEAPHVLLRALALPSTLTQSIIAKFTRRDFYNVFTNTVHVFHADRAVGMGRIAQASWMDREYSGNAKAAIRIAQVIVPGVTPFVEWHSYKEAMPKFQHDRERRHATQIYEPAFAKDVLTYGLIPFASLMPGLVDPFTGFVGPITGYVAGHLMARIYPKQNERFGWVFEGNEPLPKPNRVLYALARAPKYKIR